MPSSNPIVAEAARLFLETGRTPPKGDKGSFERQVYDRYNFVKRSRTRSEGETVRARLGHAPKGFVGRTASVFLEGPPRFVVLENLSRGDLRRAARYDALVSNLVQGDIIPAAFRRRVKSWSPIAGERFLSDPEAVLALVAARHADGEELFVCSSGRAK
jgi:hypothetical protein